MVPCAADRLRNALAQGECLGVVWLALGSAAVAELAAQSGADAVVLDLQHGLFERRELEAAIGLAGRLVPVLVRVEANDAGAIGTALDAGADGIIVPLIEGPEAAARACAFARYPPEGQRSVGGVRVLADFAAYRAGRGARPFVAVMIETQQALAQADAIAAVPGLDLVFIGTGDLALSLAAAPGDAAVAAACERIRAACQKARLACGLYTPSLAEACARRQQGYQMVVTCSDLGLLLSGFAAARVGFAPQAPALGPTEKSDT